MLRKLLFLLCLLVLFTAESSAGDDSSTLVIRDNTGRIVATTRQIEDSDLIQFRDPYGRVTGFARPIDRDDKAKGFLTTNKWGQKTGTVKEQN